MQMTTSVNTPILELEAGDTGRLPALSCEHNQRAVRSLDTLPLHVQRPLRLQTACFHSEPARRYGSATGWRARQAKFSEFRPLLMRDEITVQHPHAEPAAQSPSRTMISPRYRQVQEPDDNLTNEACVTSSNHIAAVAAEISRVSSEMAQLVAEIARLAADIAKSENEQVRVRSESRGGGSNNYIDS